MIPPITTTLAPAAVEKAWKAAQDFEALALNEFLKPMFSTIDLSKSTLGGGGGEAQWQPMMVDAVAKQIAHSGGLGIAQPVFVQMIHMQEAKDKAS